MSVSIDPDTGEVTATRPVRQSGNSAVVSLPPVMLESVGMKLGDSVEVAIGKEGRELIIRQHTR